MRSAFFVLTLLASPALAQVGPTPSTADRIAFEREQRGASEFNSSGSRKFADDRGIYVDVATIQRAGARGRCVTAASQDLSRAYLDKKGSALVLRPVFRECLRQTGDFTGSDWGDVRRAAIADALRD